MAKLKSTETIASGAQPAFSSRYKVLKKLGEGGVAVVYQVLDQKEDKIRALKTIKPEQLQDPSSLSRFEDEFRILRHLHHPGLPGMFDYGVTENGARYMVMEYIKGECLSGYVHKHPEELRLLLFEIAEALQFIHEFNLLHFDIKPENILVHRTTASGDDKPQIVLIDFGLSFRRGSGKQKTVSGTPAYMAPEIIEQKEHLTRAVDYYSLGATLFELIEGKTPFDGSMSEILRAHLYQEVIFEKQLLEYTDLYPHVISLMSKAPNDRLEGFEEFRRMLAAKASGDSPALERIYGLGYIESLGMIGKQELWSGLKNWTERAAEAIKDCPESTITSDESISHQTAPDDKIQSGFTSVDLLEQVQRSEKTPNDKIPEVNRDFDKEFAKTVVVTGPSQSGKSFLIEEFRGECLLRGMSIWLLGQDGDYESLVAENPFGQDSSRTKKPKMIDPRAIVIDRFVRGWERLRSQGEHHGVILAIDGYEAVSEEEREFLEYVGKRLDLMISEGGEPGVFIVAAGRSPRLKKELVTILPKEQTVDEFMIPPPGKNDIDKILSRFHGRMSGLDDRKRLGQYIIQKSDSSGMILESLRNAIIRGELVRESGRWRFMWAARRTKTRLAGKDSYYQLMLAELPETDRDLLSWLCCHRVSLRIDTFTIISGITEDSIVASLERLKPYRLLELTKESGKDTIGISNEAAAASLYQGVAGPKREIIHKQYIDHYQKLLHKSSKASPKKYSELRELMAFHYVQIREWRASLLMQIQAVRSLKQSKDVFGLRRVCDRGIAEAKRLRGTRWRDRKWDIERYFIRELVNAEWMVENYRGVTKVVQDHLLKRKKEIPLGVLYKYGMALRWAGKYSECSDLIKYIRNKHRKSSVQKNAYLLVIESSLLNNLNKYSKSLDILNKLKKYNNVLNNNMVSTAMIFYTLNYYNLGQNKNYINQISNLKYYAKNNNLIDELLFAQYCEIDNLFNSGQYSSAKSHLRKSIQLAVRTKMYFRLCNMYHLFSGIYYEEGQYNQAIKYLKKSISMSSDLGLMLWQANCQIKLSYNYEQNGSWGDAIKCAKRVFNISSKRNWKDPKFVSLLQLFNMYTLINSPKAKHYRDRCEALINRIESKSDKALYYYQMGNYLVNARKYKKAVGMYKQAEKYYTDVEFVDDAQRCSIKIAYVYLIIGLNEKCHKRLIKIKEHTNKMESEDLLNSYLILQMSFYYLTKKNKIEMNNLAAACEIKLKSISNISVYLDMSKILFRIYSRFGNKKKSISYFTCYHKKMSMIINQLESSDYSRSFIKESDYSIIRNEARLIKKDRSAIKADLS